MSAAPQAGGHAPLRTLLSLAWRESRTARRRLLLYMSSIALGVAALVAIDSFAANVARSVREQSRALVGGDLALTARGQFPKAGVALLDSLARTGSRVARVTSFASMALTARTGATRLVQVRAVDPGYPFYGTVTSAPAAAWSTLQQGAHAVVDRGMLIALGAHVGDTVVLGYGRFLITGTLENVPGDPGIAAVIGPRVYIPARYLPETQLLVYGSRAEREAIVKLPSGVEPIALSKKLRPRLDRMSVRVRTVAETERGLTQAIDRLSDFLGVVGLVALLLGGVGVASGVAAFVTRKIDTVAVLRCLGATTRQVLTIYLVQAVVMGFAGAAVGAALGVALQLALPSVVRDFLPVDVQVRLEPTPILVGLGIGVWVALVFALRPLLMLRRISPLQAIRRDVDRTVLRSRGLDVPRRVVELAVVASVVALAVQRTGRWRQGVGVALGIALALGALWLSAAAVTWLTRRTLRRGWPYVLRQGIANLHRPANQTRAVTLALGFGAFLVSTIYLVQSNLLRQFDLQRAGARANVLLFDIQEDQARGVDSLTRAAGTLVSSTPIVTMRIAAVNSRTTAQLLGDTTRRGAPWPLRREYRSTYRARMGDAEKVVAGRWFAAAPAAGALPEVSLERDVAKELGVGIGDTVTWDVSGVRVPTRLTSLREVQWARFEPNFFAVFQPAALEQAPKQFVVLADVKSAEGVARLQHDVVARYPNVSSIDVSLVQRTVGRIVERVQLAVRFLAVFALAMGVPVLFSAVAATRRDRLRESVLLKTLGATRAQVRGILLAEYAALGAVGAVAGMLLSFAGAWALGRFVFQGRFTPAWGAAGAIALGMIALAVAIGLLTGREAYRESPIAALREG